MRKEVNLLVTGSCQCKQFGQVWIDSTVRNFIYVVKKIIAVLHDYSRMIWEATCCFAVLFYSKTPKQQKSCSKNNSLVLRLFKPGSFCLCDMLWCLNQLLPQ